MEGLHHQKRRTGKYSTTRSTRSNHRITEGQSGWKEGQHFSTEERQGRCPGKKDGKGTKKLLGMGVKGTCLLSKNFRYDGKLPREGAEIDRQNRGIKGETMAGKPRGFCLRHRWQKSKTRKEKKRTNLCGRERGVTGRRGVRPIAPSPEGNQMKQRRGGGLRSEVQGVGSRQSDFVEKSDGRYSAKGEAAELFHITKNPPASKRGRRGGAVSLSGWSIM